MPGSGLQRFRTGLMALMVSGCAWGQQVSEEARPVRSLHAGGWIGPIELRIPEDRTWVILWFQWPPTSGGKRDEAHRELKRAVDFLNERALRDKDLLVVGLTAAAKQKAEDFVKAFGPKFPVGFGSRSARGRILPSLSRIPPPYRTTLHVDQTSDVAALLGKSDPRESTASQVPDAPDLAGADTRASELIAEAWKCVADMTRGEELGDTLEELSTHLGTQEFMRLCDELEAKANRVSALTRHIKYQRHLADPRATTKQSNDTPVGPIYREWRSSKEGDPRWTEFHDAAEAFRNREPWPPGELIDYYQSVMSDTENHLLLRQFIAMELGRTNDEELLPALRELVEMENEPRIKSYLLLAIGANAPGGDVETLRFLKSRLPREDNLFFVLPTLEMVIKLIEEEK